MSYLAFVAVSDFKSGTQVPSRHVGGHENHTQLVCVRTCLASPILINSTSNTTVHAHAPSMASDFADFTLLRDVTNPPCQLALNVTDFPCVKYGACRYLCY